MNTQLLTETNLENMVCGENGALAYKSLATNETDIDGYLCELFLVVRGENEESLKNILDKFINGLSKLHDNLRHESLVKLFKLVLFIRDPRNGKGEKDLFYSTIEHLFSLTISNNYYKKFATKLLDMVSEFGYYKDFNHIYTKTKHPELQLYVIELYVKQLELDIKNSIENTPESNLKISLASKWAPREGSVFNKMAKKLAVKLIEKINPKNTNFWGQLKEYRKSIVKLNQKLLTVQPFMCQKHWADINFKNVPSIAMTNLSKAFQDEKLSKKSNKKSNKKSSQKLNPSSTLSNRRHEIDNADYVDRETCRQNLATHVASGGKVNNKVTDLYAIIKKYYYGESIDIVWEAQWQNRINEIKEMIKSSNSKSKIFPMIDLSDSMKSSGEKPLLYAITFGLFVSQTMESEELEESFFGNRFMNFATNPQIIKLPTDSSLKDKVDVIKEWNTYGRWGGSTNIHKAIALLLNIAITNKVPHESMPKILAIFSDMQFDEGDRSWNNTSYEIITKQFVTAGYEVPHVLFWNLSANKCGYQVHKSAPNSSMLSGYSTRMLDLFLCADVETIQKEFMNNTSDSDDSDKNTVTTLSLLNKALEHKMFDPLVEFFQTL